MSGARFGRRIQEELARICSERAQRFHPPRISGLGELPEILFPSEKVFATDLQLQIALLEVLRSSVPLLEALNPLWAQPEGLSGNAFSALQRELFSLHKLLAAGMLRFEDVESHLSEAGQAREAERFAIFAELFKDYLSLLEQRSLTDRYADRLERLAAPKLRAEFSEVFLAACVDFNPSIEAALEHFSGKLCSFICAPDQHSAGFDQYGRTRADYWLSAGLTFPEDKIRVVKTTSQLPAAALNFIAEQEGRYLTDEIVISLLEESAQPRLRELAEGYELPLHEVEAPDEELSAAADFIRELLRFANSRRFSDLAKLCRLPVFASFSPELSAELTELLSELDAFHSKFLSREVPAAEKLEEKPFPRFKKLLEALEKLEFKEATFLDRACGLSKSLVPKLNQQQEFFENSCSMLESELEGSLENIQLNELAEIFLNWLENLSLAVTDEESPIEVIGWLELALDDSPLAVLLGASEGLLPEVVSADKFLPGRLREALGLASNKDRKARDRFLLELIHQSKEQFIAVSAQLSDEGEARRLSSLLFGNDVRANAQRLLSFQSNAVDFESVVAPLAREVTTTKVESLSSQLRSFLAAAPKFDSLSVSDFRTLIACPFYFLLAKTFGSERTDDTERELSAAAFGNAFHDGAYFLAKHGRFEAEDVELALHKATAKYFVFSPEPAIPVQRQLLKFRLEQFADWHQRRLAAGWEVLGLEFEIDSDKALLSHEAGATKLRARIDRVERHKESGLISIIDYKTSEQAQTPRKAHLSKRYGWLQLQLPLYRFALEAMGYKGPFELSYLGVSSSLENLELQRFDLKEEEYEDGIALAEELAARALRADFWPAAEQAPLAILDSLYEELQGVEL